jgi:PIN domain nuclease of toxin-antitoxin system
MFHLPDTHALIWFINSDNELSGKALEAIESESAINFVSVAGLGEMAINSFATEIRLKSQ